MANLTFGKKNSISNQLDKANDALPHKVELLTNSARQTKQLGQRLGSCLEAPVCLALSGELGVGKTCLAQGIMRGLGVGQEYLTSPSYTIINEYRCAKGPVFHCDLYRLSSAAQAEELGLEECLAGIALIEWPELIFPQLCQAGFLHIKFTQTGEHERRIEFIPYTEQYQRLLERINPAIIGKEQSNA